MSAINQAAKHYAEAFLAYSQADQAKGLAELLLIKDAMDQSADLKKFFWAMQIQIQPKFEVLAKVFGDKVSESTLRFIRFLLQKRKINYLLEIADQAQTLYYHQKTALCTVISVFPLAQENINAITQALAKRLGKQIQIKQKIDPSLLGGIKVVVDNYVFDGSLKRRLSDLKERLLLAAV